MVLHSKKKAESQGSKEEESKVRPLKPHGGRIEYHEKTLKERRLRKFPLKDL